MDRRRRLLWGAATGAVGLLLNLGVIDLLPTVQLLLGPLTVIGAAVLLGGAGGSAAAVVSASRTVFLWENPWGWLVAICEGAVVGRLSRRLPPVLADAVFWVVAGPPLFLLTYVGLAHIPIRLTVVMGIKQAINSLLAALIVQVVLLVPAVRQRLRSFLPRPVADIPVSTAVASVLALGAIFPLCVVVAVEGRARYDQALTAARRENQETARVMVEQMEETVAHARLGSERLATELAQIVARQGTLPSAEVLDGELRLFEAYSPELASAFVTGPEFRSLAFEPPLGADGQPNVAIDFSDRPYLQVLRTGQSGAVSDAYIGRRTAALIVAVSTAIRVGGELKGAVVASLDLRHLARYARERTFPGQRVVVLDGVQSVIIDTAGRDNVLSSLAGTPLGEAVRDAAPGSIGRYVSDPRAVLAVRNRSERDFSVLGVSGTGWRVVVEQPTTQIQRQVEASYLSLLYVIAVALGLAALSAIPLSSILVAPIRGVGRAADALAAGDRTARSPPEARDAPLELRELAQDFDHMADQLSGQLDAIEQASAEKDAFLSVASHELRTPLTAIKVQVELLRRRVGEAHAERLDTLDRQVDRVGRLINQLLDAARLGTGQLPLDPVTCDLSVMARRVAETLVSTSPQHSLKLDLEPAVGEWDELRMEQVLHNLVSNAIKYSPSGGAIELVVRVAAEGQARLTVADRGIGLTEADAPGLFERFSRGTGPEVGSIKGLGVGLYVSREIVHRHGGTIRLQPRPGGGALATVVLPGAHAAPRGAAQTG
jgi:signal transduction histidine kinase